LYSLDNGVFREGALINRSSQVDDIEEMGGIGEKMLRWFGQILEILPSSPFGETVGHTSSGLVSYWWHVRGNKP